MKRNLQTEILFKKHVKRNIYLCLLPKEIIFCIINYFEIKDLSNFCKTCKNFNKILNDKNIWIEFLKNNFKLNLKNINISNYNLLKIYEMYHYISIINNTNKILFRKESIKFIQETPFIFKCEILNLNYIKNIKNEIIEIIIIILNDNYLIKNNYNDYSISLNNTNNFIENVYKIIFGKCYNCNKILFRCKVKKESINKDRYFYSCNKCDYFIWETLNDNSIKCKFCNNIIHKQIAGNKSKHSGWSFYSCKECDYFTWIF